MVRRALVVLSLSLVLLSCATPRPAPPSVIKATPLSASALIKRDNLEHFFDLSEGFTAKLLKAPTRVSTAELNGVAPPELVIETSQIVSELLWVEAMWLYDVTDPANPVRIHSRGAKPHYITPGPAWIRWKTYSGSRRWIKDLDGDGRAELVWSADAWNLPEDLAIFDWGVLEGRDQGMRDMLWYDPRGKHVLIVDVDDDGVSEVVSLDLPDYAADRLAVIRKLVDGTWRVDARSPSVAQLQRIFEAMIEDVDQPDHGVSLVFTASLMRERGVSPRDVAALQRRLEALLASADIEESMSVQDDLYEAMVWPDNPRAYELLSRRLREQERPSPGLGRALLALDAVTGQTRGRAAVLERLGLALERLTERDDQTDVWVRSWPLRVLLEALSAHKIEDGAALLARRLTSPDLSQELYEEIVRQGTVMRHLGGQRALLRPLWADEALAARRAAFVDGMGAALLGEGSSSPLWAQVMRMTERGFEGRASSSPWREVMTAEELRALLADKRLTKLQHAYLAAQGLLLGDISFMRDLVGLTAWLDADDSSWIFLALARHKAPLPARGQLRRWVRDATDSTRVFVLLYWALSSGGSPALVDIAAEQHGAPQISGLTSLIYSMIREGCESGLCERDALDDATRDQLHVLLQKLSPFIAPEARAELFIQMASLEGPAASAYLLEVAQQEPSPELRSAARMAMILNPHPLTVPYLFSEAMGGAEDAAHIFDRLGEHIDAASLARVQELVLTRTPDSADPVYRAQLRLLADAAPRLCPRDREAFWKIAFAGEDICKRSEPLVQLLALCEPAMLERLLQDNVLIQCEMALSQSALDVVVERGTSAHLSWLDWLRLTALSRPIRDRIVHAADALTKRLNKR
jgi:hypothetical protein